MMPSLISFEWQKCPDGYTVETFRLDYLRFALESAPSETDPHGGSCRLMAHPAGSAPEWVRSVLADPHDNPFANRAWFDSIDAGSSWIDPVNLRSGYPFPATGGGEVKLIVPRSQRLTRFEPLKESKAAFMEFAECASSDADVAGFVTKYGYPSNIADPGGFRTYGEPFGTLYTLDRLLGQAYEMRWAVGLWAEAIETGHYGELQIYFDRNAPGQAGEPGFVREMPDCRPAVGRYPRAAGRPVLSQLNASLRSRPGQDGPPILLLAPRDLEAGLWLQFAQAVSANLQLQRCAFCPTWFAYGTGTGRRKSAQYCSDPCRKAAHRQRAANGGRGTWPRPSHGRQPMRR